MLEEKKEPQSRPEYYYSEMLLRQFPWLKEKLINDEYPIAFSYKKPETLLGLSLLFIGLFVAMDTLLHLTAFSSILSGILIVLLGAALFYSGFWAIFYAKRSYILVTSERIVLQKINVFGLLGKTISIPRSEIKRVRFLKSTVMYRVEQGDGSISIEMKSGETILVSRVHHGENILGALR